MTDVIFTVTTHSEHGVAQSFTCTFVASAILLTSRRLKARFMYPVMKWGSTCTEWLNSGTIRDLLSDDAIRAARLLYIFPLLG